MIDQIYPYRKTTLESMFNLDKGDLDIIIEAEGIPYYFREKDEFIGYLPSINSFFLMDEESSILCQRNVAVKNYNITLQDSLIKISSKVETIPVCSLLYNNAWVNKANDLLEIDENFSLLISNRPEVPIFCGHKRFVNRLAENFAGDVSTINAIDFIKKWGKA